MIMNLGVRLLAPVLVEALRQPPLGERWLRFQLEASSVSRAASLNVQRPWKDRLMLGYDLMALNRSSGVGLASRSCLQK